MPREADLVKNLILKVRIKFPGAYVRKISDRFSRGIPDVLIVYRGVALFVEAKWGRGRPSPIQEVEHRQIAAAGGNVVVAFSVEDVERELENLLAAAGRMAY